VLLGTPEALVGGVAKVLENIDGEGWVWAFGERWHACSAVPLARGRRARIVAVDGLTLIVEPAEQGEKQ
jgi:membrane-bound serine protease (ClpP class)